MTPEAAREGPKSPRRKAILSFKAYSPNLSEKVFWRPDSVEAGKKKGLARRESAPFECAVIWREVEG